MSQNSVFIRQFMHASGVRFGTSGIRGLVEAMTPELCFYYASAFIQTLPKEAVNRVAIGIDLRPSSPGIARACAAAIRHAGLQVEFCGVLPTPALAFYAQERGIPAIMVTGSHIPFDRNGIKFYGLDGEITKADEAAIAASEILALPTFPMMPELVVDPAATECYHQRYVGFFPQGVLAGLRLAVYEHSSAARDMLREILEALGAEVVSLGRTDAFVPIDTEAVSEYDVAMARCWADEVGFDAIISTDGDADRPLIGDEAGQWLRGDVVGILCAEFLGAEAVVTPVSSNTALEGCGRFKRVARTRIGSPYVIEGMRACLQDACGPVVGFEANGGFLLGSTVHREGRELLPLMTRDAVLPVLALLAMSREQGCAVSGLLQRLPARYTGSGRLQSFPTEISQKLIQGLSDDSDTVTRLLGDLCGPMVSQDRTDGLRMTFENGEVVHFRPSGNAPELRCYAEAETQARANALAAMALQRLDASRHV